MGLFSSLKSKVKKLRLKDLPKDIKSIKRRREKKFVTEAGQAYQRTKNTKLKDKLFKPSKSVGVKVAKEVGTRIRYAPSAIKGAAQRSAVQEQAKHYPTKQIKKTILDAGYLVAHQERPFSATVKSAGFGGRGGGRGRSRRGSTSSRATPRAGLSSTKTSSYLGNEPVDPNDPYGF